MKNLDLKLSIVLLSIAVTALGQLEEVCEKTLQSYESTGYLFSNHVHLQDGFHFKAGKPEHAPEFYVKEANGIYCTKYNSVVEITSLEKGIKTYDDLLNTDHAEKLEQHTYLDGLGRYFQTVNVKSTPSIKDHVSYVSYDDYGRVEKDYLPYPAGGVSSHVRETAVDDQAAYYSGNNVDENTTNPYFENRYQKNPIATMEKTAYPGDDWKMGSGHEQKFIHDLTSSGDGIQKFILQSDGTVISDGNLDNYHINVNGTEDENDKNGSIEITNGVGQLICQAKYNASTLSASDYLYTYYIYDDKDQLRKVISPKGIQSFNSTSSITQMDQNFLSLWAFQYDYDGADRLIKKKVPGRDWEYYWYDKWGRLACRQDGNMRNSDYVNNQYTHGAQAGYGNIYFFQYDRHNRVVKEGLWQPSQNQTYADVQALIDNYTGERFEILDAQDQFGYTSRTFPNGSKTYYKIYYHDAHSNISSYYSSGESFEPSSLAVDPTPYTNTKGKLVAYLEQVPTNSYRLNVLHYDKKGRVIQTKTTFGGANTHVVTAKYDFTGKLSEAYTKHRGAESADIHEQYFYDHEGRIIEVRNAINGNTPEVLSRYTYNELGQVKEHNLGENTLGAPLQSLDMQYTVRGWLKSINNANLISNDNDAFGFELNYNSSGVTGNASPLYNGNISEMVWASSRTTSPQAYVYRYNYLDQLETADYYIKDGDWSSSNENGRFNVSIDGYDKNGNIEGLDRKGAIGSNQFGTIDDLSYGYLGNKLVYVNDAQGHNVNLNQFKEISNTGSYTNHEYLYDDNGNVVEDKNKGIKIFYNIHNLPSRVEFTQQSKYIKYSYNQDGIKIRKEVYDNNNLSVKYDYLDAVHYENGAIAFISNEVGRALPKSGTNSYTYEYFLKDHLGNNRIVISRDINGDADITQEDSYYPFGLTFNSYVNGDKNKYLFNQGTGEKTFQGNDGKSFRVERQPEIQLDMTKYRMYDYTIGRFINADPLADHPNQIDQSPYQYAWNNPVVYNDPEGDCPWCWIPAFVGYMLSSKPVNAPGHNKEANAKAMQKAKESYDKSIITTTAIVTTLIYGNNENNEQPNNEPQNEDGNDDPLDSNGPTNENAKELKKVPNPNGKKGGPDHQKVNEQVARDIESRGNIAQPEEKVNTPKGDKTYRYADQAEKDPNTGEVIKYHQVGKQNKNGTPVSREKKAADDIQKATGKPVEFHPYNK